MNAFDNPMIKKRRPVFAILLSMLLPGLGHLYAGNAVKALALVALELGVVILLGATGLLATFNGIVALFVFFFLFYLYATVSAARLAYRNRDYTLKPFNRWYGYLGFFIGVNIVVNVLFSYRASLLGYEMYRIPAHSMAPTLDINDFITVDTTYAQPKVGEVIVFRNPANRSVPFVKRIAALGNDTISIEHGTVFRNGRDEMALYVPDDKRSRPFSLTMNAFTVPENTVFVLGDWRDNSQDSRVWGPVPTSDIIGKVTYIWLSPDSSRIGWEVK